MSILKAGRIAAPNPNSPSIYLGSACATLASVCLTAPDKAGCMRAQTEEILAHIDELLGQLGSSKAEVLMAQVWLADITQMSAFATAWGAWVLADHAPALSVVQAEMSQRDSLVEIRVYAARQP